MNLPKLFSPKETLRGPIAQIRATLQRGRDELERIRASIQAGTAAPPHDDDLRMAWAQLCDRERELWLREHAITTLTSLWPGLHEDEQGRLAPFAPSLPPGLTGPLPLGALVTLVPTVRETGVTPFLALRQRGPTAPPWAEHGPYVNGLRQKAAALVAQDRDLVDGAVEAGLPLPHLAETQTARNVARVEEEHLRRRREEDERETARLDRRRGWPA